MSNAAVPNTVHVWRTRVVPPPRSASHPFDPLVKTVLAPVIGHLTSAVVARGAFAMWLPGTADRAVVAALRAGFRLDQFPILLCWDRPFGDLSRYLPISPGLL